MKTRGTTSPSFASSCTELNPVCGANLFGPVWPAVVRLGGVFGALGFGVNKTETTVRIIPKTIWVVTPPAVIALIIGVIKSFTT